jgi:hypothetical protein
MPPIDFTSEAEKPWKMRVPELAPFWARSPEAFAFACSCVHKYRIAYLQFKANGDTKPVRGFAIAFKKVYFDKFPVLCTVTSAVSDEDYANNVEDSRKISEATFMRLVGFALPSSSLRYPNI